MNARQESDVNQEISSTARYRRILVATDGSACSERAATHAVYLAETLGARAFHMGIHFGEAVAESSRFGQNAIDAVREMAQERGLECENILVEASPTRASSGPPTR
jgi:nucleotide-binding universal stress UspA family protein